MLPLVLALAWVWAGGGGNNILMVPALGTIARALQQMLGERQFWTAAAITLGSTLAGYMIACLGGLLAGGILSRSAFWSAVFAPVLAGIYTVPLILLLPLFVFWFGIGAGSKISYAACYAIWPIALNTLAGLAAADRQLLLAGQAMGASRLEIFRHIVLPAAMPGLFNGLPTGLFISFAAVLGAEAVISSSGIGHSLAMAGELAETPRIYALILVVALVALLLNAALARLLAPENGQ